jgi:hypothetical protein
MFSLTDDVMGEELLEYSAVLEGSANNSKLEVSGSGRINATQGLTKGEYRLHEVPDDFDPLFLTAALLTGYPNACAEIDEVLNPFKGRSYEYERQIIFSSGQHLHLKVECKLNGKQLNSRFFLSGSTPQLSLHGVEPIVETWVPTATKRLAGQFTIGWMTSLNQIATAEARSDYHVEWPQEFPSITHRFIDLAARAAASVLILEQRSFKFHRLPVCSA